MNSLFVCLACGKWSEDQYGNKKHSKGWDVSCAMNSTIVPIEKIVLSEDKQRVVRIKEETNG